ncbi:MAG: Sir2 family NAD-dependent protein deacetylase, partial [Thermodesulfobacteriota bacterium]
MIDTALKELLVNFAKSREPICVLTGAGISAESQIPTFRGPEGFWTVGSREYHPQEMATFQMFLQYPDEVWRWYLYRMGICKTALPNPGHLAVSEMERMFGGRFTLITQNVDGLHLRSGNSPERTFQIHGNIFHMRCAGECTRNIYPLPPGVSPKSKEEPLTEEDRRLLRCPACGHLARPHVLWFDESYDEIHYRYVSSLETARKTKLLITVGTSGATNLPNQVVHEVKRSGGILIDINMEENPFSRAALSGKNGFFLKGKSG